MQRPQQARSQATATVLREEDLIEFCCYYCEERVRCSRLICFNALGGLSYMRYCKTVGLGGEKSCGERFTNLKKPVAEVNKQCWRPKHG